MNHDLMIRVIWCLAAGCCAIWDQGLGAEGFTLMRMRFWRCGNEMGLIGRMGLMNGFNETALLKARKCDGVGNETFGGVLLQ